MTDSSDFHDETDGIESEESHRGDGPGFFERPQTIRALIGGLIVVCVGLALADLAYTNPHPHFAIETTFAFQAWFGFVTFVVIVFLGRMLRPIVSRPEDYYDRDR